MTRFVAVFSSAASLSAFRIPEFLAVAEVVNVPIYPLTVSSSGYLASNSSSSSDCYFYFFETTATVEELTKVAERCILLRGLYVLLCAAPTLEALYTRGGNYCGVDTVTVAQSSKIDGEVLLGANESRYMSGDYCFHVETIGKKYSADEKRTIIDNICDTIPGHPPRLGQVSYTSPVHRFYLFVQHRLISTPPGAHSSAIHGPLMHVVYVVLLAESHRSRLLHDYDLKRRPYIGTTSMPPEEALLMSNLARVQRGQLVYDPFCGTGSLLVAAANYGAHILASDVDARTMRQGSSKSQCSAQMQQQRQLALDSRTAEELDRLDEQERHSPTLWTNFKLYQLPVPDRIRMNLVDWKTQWRRGAPGGDGASNGAECSSTGCMFDTIITDPPYGIRESRVDAHTKSSRKATATPGECISTSAWAPASPNDDDGGTCDTVSLASRCSNSTPHSHAAVSRAEQVLSSRHELYSGTRIAIDLVLFAADKLSMGGYLCFWYATHDCSTDDELPTHPCLTLIANIPQRLSLKMVRKLIVMRKTSCMSYPGLLRSLCTAEPSKRTVDLRTQLDITDIPENVDYMHYRAKIQRKRLAAAAFHAQHDETGVCDATNGAHKKSETEEELLRRRACYSSKDQHIMVANRLRNIRIRKEKQEASHRANAVAAQDAKQKRIS